MEREQRKLPKIAALAAPAFVWLAAACDTAKPEPKNNLISPTPEGQVGGAFSNPTIAPAIETITPNTKDHTIRVKNGALEYELYTDVTIDQIIETANSLLERNTNEFNSKESILNNLQGVRTMLKIKPEDTSIITSLNRVVNVNDANCQEDTSRQITKQIASLVYQNYPDKYVENSILYEQGPCSVSGENQIAAPTPKPNEAPTDQKSFEPYTDRNGNEVHTAIKGNYAYTYTLILNIKPKDAIVNLKSYVVSPNLDAYIPDPAKRTEVTSLYDKAEDKANSNPNDPEIAILLLEASSVLKDVCTNGFHRTIMRGNASIINFVDSELWQQHQFELLDSNCFDSKKFVISPEFKIYPFENGTFVYEGVTHEDVLSYAEKLRQIYPRDSGTIIDWLEYASNNRGTPEEDTGLNSASFILQGGCKDNDVAFNLIRLMASVKGSKDQESLDLLRLRACYSAFFKDEYFFER